MKERPILFNGEMVRAILDGRKTQTRRVVNLDKHKISVAKFGEIGEIEWSDVEDRVGWRACLKKANYKSKPFKSPFGVSGDRLWVREAFADLLGTGVEHHPTPTSERQRFAYAADSLKGSASDERRKEIGVKWKPSIHMPRWASRILLENASISVERVQDISREDAIADGITQESWDRNDWVWVVTFKRIEQDGNDE